ncbi:Ig-like domain-containing protein [Massilia agilis]|uniref:Ig-like domain-containing protein n=1 Tax=Massilia agilis TaxID=1811226 RepID=A0ABT2DHV0_9BURK|nr:Ig-like domain-containing protein [Massilia agilis]MCS0810728.1 Ig-like domain-containing protein [Massilia agilis]
MTRPTSFLSGPFAASAAQPGVVLMQGSSRSSADIAFPVPIFGGATPSGAPDHMSIDLVFSTAMALRSGAIWITDGAVQTVVDRGTGLPTMRIIGATDTKQVAASSVHFSGNHVVIDGWDLQPQHSYSVVMAPGALASSSGNAFGTLNPGMARFDTGAAVDRSAPTLVSMNLSSSMLRSGAPATLTIKFSEAVPDFNASMVTTPNAVLTNLQSDDKITWTATLSATDLNVETSANVGINMINLHDAAGNAGIPTSLAASYQVDTKPPALPSIQLAGIVLDSAHTIGLTLVFTEPVQALPAAAISAPHATVGALATSDNGRTWTATLSAADTTPSSGNQVSVDLGKVLDIAGNAGSGTVSSSASYAIATAPTGGLTATVALSGATTLRAGGAAPTVTITFSEGVSSLDPGAVSTPNAQLQDLHPVDASGTTWSATLAPGAGGINAPSNAVAIDMARVVSTANHTGTGTASSGNYAVDTIVTAWLAPTVSINDTGVSSSDYLTTDSRLNLKGCVIGLSGSGAPADGTSVRLMLDGVDASASLAFNNETQKYTWSAFNSTVLAEGAHQVTAWLQDATGHHSAQVTQVFTIDSTLPSLTGPATGATQDASSPLLLNFSEPVYLDPSVASTALQLENVSAYAGIASITIDDRNFSADHKTLAVSADALHLAGGSTYRVTLPGAVIMDRAGNLLPASSVELKASGTYTDTTAPSALRADGVTSSGWPGKSYPAGTTIDIAVLFDEAVRAVSGQTPSLALNTGGTATYKSASSDGKTLHFSYTVGASDADTARLDIADASGLAGKIEDLAGNKLDASHIQVAPLNLEWNIAVDTHAPAALNAPSLYSYSDHGISHSDRLTNDATPTLTGTGAEPDAREIQLYEGSTRIGGGYANADGTWFADVFDSKALSDGVHTLSVLQMDQAGNLGPLSATVQVTIDTVAPASVLSAPALDPSSDTGVSNSDHITRDTTPTLTGTAAPNSLVRIYLLQSTPALMGEGVADASGKWSITSKNLVVGSTYQYVVRQCDDAGNEGPDSPALTITMDTNGPTLSSSTASVASGAAFILKFNERIDVASVGALTLYDSANHVVATYAAGANWSVGSDGSHDISVFQIDGLANGAYKLHAESSQAADLAGNVSLVGLPDLVFTVGPPTT